MQSSSTTAGFHAAEPTSTTSRSPLPASTSSTPSATRAASRCESPSSASRAFVAGRDKTKLVEGLARQREAVRATLAETIPATPVHACFCFLNPDKQAGGSGLPLLRTLQIDDFPLYYPRRLSKRLNAPGALSAESRRKVAELLAAKFAGLPIPDDD
jgi:hypothetical protein